jgi:hypothetical protein
VLVLVMAATATPPQGEIAHTESVQVAVDGDASGRVGKNNGVDR